MATTENFVRDHIFTGRIGVANRDLFSFGHHVTIDGTRVVRCPAAAPTERFDLKSMNSISQLDESCRAWKERGSKIRKNSECEDINGESVDDVC